MGINHDEIISNNNNFNYYRNLYPTFFIKLFLNSIVFFLKTHNLINYCNSNIIINNVLLYYLKRGHGF